MPNMYCSVERSDKDDLVEVGKWPRGGLRELRNKVLDAMKWASKLKKRMQDKGVVTHKEFLKLTRYVRVFRKVSYNCNLHYPRFTLVALYVFSSQGRPKALNMMKIKDYKELISAGFFLSP